MRVFNRREELQSAISELRSAGRSIGFVPTMGALHQGHLSLVEKALSECDRVVVSIFVNPTQFNNADDLKKYPRTLEADVALLETVHQGLMVYAPGPQDIYRGDVTALRFNFKGLENVMEGTHRPGHFDGVGTIVKLLFETVRPQRAYFGEKDFQQLQIIRTLVRQYHLPITVVGCPIKREANGLAMSSRNERLSPALRQEAGFIYRTLQLAREKFKTLSAGQVKKWVQHAFAANSLLDLEYVEITHTDTLRPVVRKRPGKTYRIFVAVQAGPVRLIDNIALN